jgi:Na+/H+-dicarboxylate symporter
LVALTTIHHGGSISLSHISPETAHLLQPEFEFSLGGLISNDIALMLGAVSGFASYFLNGKLIYTIAQYLEKFTKYYFKILIPVMPIFIVGTALKLEYDGILNQIITKYFTILVVFVASAYCFILLQYLLLAKFKLSLVTKYLRHMLPATITAFGSMSSASALPLSIKAAEENCDRKDHAGIIVPATVNVHLVGDCFFIPMIAIVIMISFALAPPTVSNYLIFAIHFVVSKFAVAAIPGGGILVMIPILQAYLGFSTEMIGLITALYVLFDPLITACNVMGNGAMAMIFDRLTRIFKVDRNKLSLN